MNKVHHTTRAVPALVLVVLAPLVSVRAEPEVVAVYRDGRFTTEDLEARLAALDPHFRQRHDDESESDWKGRILSEALVERVLAARLPASKRTRLEVDQRLRDAMDAVTSREVYRVACADLPVTIGDASIETEYRRRVSLGLLDKPATLRFRSIFIDTHLLKTEEEWAVAYEKATRAMEELHKGGDFAAVAEEYSEAPKPREALGEIVTARVDQLNPMARTELGRIQPGQTSEVILGPYGYVIFKHEGFKETGVESLDEVRDRIREDLESSERTRRYQKWVDGLAASVTVHRTYAEIASALPHEPVLRCGDRLQTVSDSIRLRPRLLASEVEGKEREEWFDEDRRRLAQLCWAESGGLAESSHFKRAAGIAKDRVLTQVYLESITEVTEEDIQQVYASYPEAFGGGMTYRVRQVRVPVQFFVPEPSVADVYLTREEARIEAEEIVKRARNGEDLGMLAKERGLEADPSPDRGAAPSGNEGGTQERFRSMIDLGYDGQETLRGLSPGQTSDPFYSDKGYYLITQLLETRLEPPQPLADPDVRARAWGIAHSRKLERIRAELTEQILQELDFRVN